MWHQSKSSKPALAIYQNPPTKSNGKLWIYTVPFNLHSQREDSKGRDGQWIYKKCPMIDVFLKKLKKNKSRKQGENNGVLLQIRLSEKENPHLEDTSTESWIKWVWGGGLAGVPLSASASDPAFCFPSESLDNYQTTLERNLPAIPECQSEFQLWKKGGGGSTNVSKLPLKFRNQKRPRCPRARSIPVIFATDRIKNTLKSEMVTAQRELPAG